METSRSVSLTPALREEYAALYSSCELVESKRQLIESTARAVSANKERYEVVAGLAKVPWYVIGAIHSLECGGRFDRHPHNGDPLTAKTVHVPKNRPPGTPPFTWEMSALDALAYDGFTTWSDWTIPGLLYKLESYNGFGYRLRHPTVKSPYLWSFTTHYERGKYAADGRFDPKLVSQQVGVAALLRALDDLELIDIGGEREPAREPAREASRGRKRGPAPALRTGAPSAPVYPGRVIKQGEADRAIVRQIQERLVAVGCGPIDEGDDFGAETDASVRLFQSRAVNSSGAPLRVDGCVGPHTWEALFGARSVPAAQPSDVGDKLVSTALAIAASQVGVVEDPPFSNSGKEVNAYLASVGLGPGAPWCAAFVHYCFQQAAEQLGVESPVVKTGHCLTHWQKAGERGVRRVAAAQAVEDPSLIIPGQVFIMDYGAGKGHTGIVESVRGGMLVTIEGNTNSEGSREGGGVYRRTQRSVASINKGFIDYSSIRGWSGPKERGEPARGPASADVAPLVLTASAGGLLRKAVEQGLFERPTWVEIEFDGLRVMVGAHALRASVGGRLLRLPASYTDTIAIANALGWIAPTAPLTDAIWKAATVRVRPTPLGDRRTPEASALTDKKMGTLEFAVKHNECIDALIPRERWGELAATEGKDWIIARRNLMARRAATTYGWHRENGKPIQGLGLDSRPPAHNDTHCDYSQTLRPIQRKARRVADGAEVDLVDELISRGMPEKALAPFRTAGGAPARSAKRARRASKA